MAARIWSSGRARAITRPRCRLARRGAGIPAGKPALRRALFREARAGWRAGSPPRLAAPLSFKTFDFREAAAVPLSPGKPGAHIRPDQVDSELWSHYARPQAHHVAVVVLDGLVS